MNRKTSTLILTGLLMAGPGTVFACEYKAGETKFIDYANCRYGSDSIVVVELSKNTVWDNCIYYMQAFMPGKLLAVSKERNGKEQHSINTRGSIGNPAYLMKQTCDAALKASEAQ